MTTRSTAGRLLGRLSNRAPALLLAVGLGATALAGAIGVSYFNERQPPPPLPGLSVIEIALGGQPMTVAVADTSELRRRGLTGVSDLGSLDGLLFVYDSPIYASFVMRDVPIPLDIVFIDGDARVLGVTQMPSCTAEPCPLYPSPGAMRWAVETEAGGLNGVEVGDLLEFR